MKMHFLWKIALFVLPLFLSAQTPKNLVPNPHLAGAEGWNLNAHAAYDPLVSTTPGSGSIRLSKTGRLWSTTDFASSKFKIPVIPGKTYTLSFKTMTHLSPSPILHVTGAFYGHTGWVQNAEATKYANAHTEEWEETVIYVKVPKNPRIKYFSIKIFMQPKYSKDGDIWIDDILFAKGLHFSSPSTKKPFLGTFTRVDALGNVEVFENGQWKPFFPMCIYADSHRKDWSIYKKQGFNTNMWASSAQTIQKAKNAGLYSGLQVVDYMLPGTSEKKISRLLKTLREIKEKNLMQNLLFYYIDNEIYTLPYEMRLAAKMIKQKDLDANGKRMHPIYMLNGDYGLTRQYNSISDITGTYVKVDALVVQQNIQGQTQPVVIAQINDGIGLNFRPILFGAIAKGAKGMGFWRDYLTKNRWNVGPIEKQPWWPDLPNIAREIKQMMPLIRADHHTRWKARCDDDDLILGTRTLEGTGYMILANPTDRKLTAKISFSGLAYRPKIVRDYFTKVQAAKILDHDFVITLPPHGTKVVSLAHE